MCFTNQLFAQFPWIQYYPMENIANSGRYKDLVIDDWNRLWISTDHGMMMYDGGLFTSFPEATRSNYVKSLLKTDDGEIYIVNDLGLELLEFDGREPVFLNLLEANQVPSDTSLSYPKTIYQAVDKSIWVGEDSVAVKVVDDKIIKRYSLGPNWQSRNYMKSITFQEDGYGNLWAFSFIGNVYRYAPGADTFVNLSVTADLSILSFVKRMELNTFWIGTANGVYEMEVNASGEIVRLEWIINIRNISCIHVLDDQFLLLGTWSQGLYILGRNNENYVTKPLDIPGLNDITNIRKRGNNQLWIIGSETIGQLNISPFRYYEIDPDYNLIRSVHPLSKDSVLVATDFKLSVLSREQACTWTIASDYMVDGLYFFLAVPYQGEFVLGDQLGGLYRFKPELGQMYRVDGVPPGEAYLWLYEDIDKKLWACGNHRNGLMRIDENFEVSVYDPDLTGDIYVIRCGDDGQCFAAGEAGIPTVFRFNFRDNSFSPIKLKLDPLVSGTLIIEDLYIGNDEVLLATHSGLYRFSDNGKEEQIATRVDLPELAGDINLKAIQKSDDGALWLAGETNLIWYKDGLVQVFDHTNSLPSGAMHFRGIEKDDYGNLWLATEKGLAFLPNGFIRAQKTETPDIQISFYGVNKDSLPQLIDNQLSLPYGSNLEFRFATSMFPQDLISYQTRILEIDTNWSALKPDRILNALNFNNGFYTLQVRARYKGMLVSETNQITFQIRKPWFKEIWFYFSSFAALFVLILIILIVYNRRFERSKKKTLAEVKSRNEEKLEELRVEILDEQKKQMELNKKISKLKSQFDTEKSVLDTEIKYRDQQIARIRDDIELRNKQLSAQMLKTIQKDQAFQKVFRELKKARKDSPESVQLIHNRILKLIEHQKIVEKDWESFRYYFQEVHHGFDEKLSSAFPALTAQDLRHCALIRAKLSMNECASLLGISPDSVKTARHRLKKKLKLTPEQSLLDFLMNI